MTDERIKQLRKVQGDMLYMRLCLWEALDEIERLKADVKAATKAIVKLSKNAGK